jgi:phytoene synthase
MDAFAHCEALVRAADKDRFLATLFAPAQHRGALHALYAFNIEIARVRESIREPLAGEIRLQWWADALAGIAAGEVRSNPVAAALLSTLEHYSLPVGPLAELIETRRFDLYDDPMRSLEDLEAYGRRTSAALINLGAGILSGSNPAAEAIAKPAGSALAITNLLVAFPLHVARGQLYVPLELLERHGVRQEDIAARQASLELRAVLAELRALARVHLRQAGDQLAAVPAAALPALLPVALVNALLDRMEAAAYDPFAPLEISAWRRQWRIWRASRRPARMFRS